MTIVTVHKIPDLKNCFEIELHRAINRPKKGAGFYSKRLNDSIRYAICSSGKRLRPLMVLAVALAHNQRRAPNHVIKLAMPVAIAMEFIHTYSLIHDDLPAMDNDDYRRGRLTLHRRYDEALAILAGDALLADAFFFAASSTYNSGPICLRLSEMAGSMGLVAGQSEDLNQNQPKPEERWLAINEAKTARMFEACALASMLALDYDRASLESARIFGHTFGAAFQIHDDLIDQTIPNDRKMLEMLAEKIQEARTAASQFPIPDFCLELLTVAFGNRNNCGGLPVVKSD